MTRQAWLSATIYLAIGCCRVLAEDPPPQPCSLGNAQSLIKKSDFPTAESCLRNYLPSHLGSAETRYLLAFVLFRENRPRESLDEYTRAAQLEKPDSSQLRFVALNYVLLNDYPDAEKWIRASLTLNESNFETWYDLGRILQTRGRSSEALEAFDRSLALNPKNAKAENNRGLVYESLNRPEEADKAYRRAIALQQQTGVASEQPFLNLGVSYTNKGEFDEAESMLTAAASIAPKDPKIREELGRLYLREEHWQQAATELQKATALNASIASPHFLLGQAYRHLGDADRARTEFARAAELNGTHSSPAQ